MKPGQWGQNSAESASHLSKCSSAHCSPISSEGNELLVQFVSDLSVTADGFSASYRTLPRDAVEKESAPSPGEDTQRGPQSRSDPKAGTGPKVKPPAKPKSQPAEKPEANPATQATPVAPGKWEKVGEGTGGMAWWLRALVGLPEDPGVIRGLT